MVDKAKFELDGYGIAKHLMSADEIKKLREDVRKQYEIDKSRGLTFQIPGVQAKFVKGDLLSKELLSKVILNDKIHAIAREILDSEKLVYFGDSSYQIGTGMNGFHRDNIDRADMNGPDWKGKYTLLRLGIYLQEHKNYSGGLKIRKGSHKNRSGKAIFVESEVGDVVFWDLKTLHSGNAVRLKAMPDFTVNIAMLERNIPVLMRKEEEKERISLFMTFALESSHLNRYLREYTLKRKDTIEHAKASVYNPVVLEKAKLANIKIVNPLEYPADHVVSQ